MAHHPIGLGKDLQDANSDQRRILDKIASGPRGSVPSPFLAMLDRPALADTIQEVGAQIRYSGILSAASRELAILTTAAAVGCRYEWNYHAPIARSAGVPDEAVRATQVTAADCSQEFKRSPWSAIIRFCRAVTLEHRVSEADLTAMLDMVGKEATSELIAICGYYSLLANFIIIGQHEPD